MRYRSRPKCRPTGTVAPVGIRECKIEPSDESRGYTTPYSVYGCVQDTEQGCCPSHLGGEASPKQPRAPDGQGLK